ncbi:MAG: hypothetical protein J5I90_07895 [Caldilineales bacterium]|nr:hypothetical protein [Caldilineales bacterium]
MAEIAELSSEATIKLPQEVAAKFKPNDRFFVWTDGDTMHLKRVNLVSVTEIVMATEPDDDALSLDEINEIVHEVRQQKRTD